MASRHEEGNMCSIGKWERKGGKRCLKNIFGNILRKAPKNI